jgi:hypothetical protein
MGEYFVFLFGSFIWLLLISMFLQHLSQDWRLTLVAIRFTARGIVALVFSCVAGIVGILVVAWYGMADPGEDAPAGAKKMIAETEQSVLAETQEAPQEVTATNGSKNGVTSS